MPKSYSPESTHIKPTKINKETLAAIGRLIRAFAEIEDLLTLHICNLTSVPEGRIIVLLGRTAMSKLLEIAEYFAKTAGANALAAHKNVFNRTFQDALGCRNAVAHGTLLGRTQHKELTFLTAKTEVPTGTATVLVVESYLPKNIIAYAKMAELAVPLIEKNLMLRALRQARLRKPLSPHPKGLRQQSGKQKQ
jgi:hypothetical protein